MLRQMECCSPSLLGSHFTKHKTPVEQQHSTIYKPVPGSGVSAVSECACQINLNLKKSGYGLNAAEKCKNSAMVSQEQEKREHQQ